MEYSSHNGTIGFWLDDNETKLYTPLGTYTWGTNSNLRAAMTFNINWLTFVIAVGRKTWVFTPLGPTQLSFKAVRSLAPQFDSNGTSYRVTEGYQYDVWTRLPWFKRHRRAVSRIEFYKAGSSLDRVTTRGWNLSITELHTVVRDALIEFARPL